MGHVRYPTAGSESAMEAQPFFVNSPLGIYLIHNGNLTNTAQLRGLLNSSSSFFNRYLRTDSDSEVRRGFLGEPLHVCRYHVGVTIACMVGSSVGDLQKLGSTGSRGGGPLL